MKEQSKVEHAISVINAFFESRRKLSNAMGEDHFSLERKGIESDFEEAKKARDNLAVDTLVDLINLDDKAAGKKGYRTKEFIGPFLVIDFDADIEKKIFNIVFGKPSPLGFNPLDSKNQNSAITQVQVPFEVLLNPGAYLVAKKERQIEKLQAEIDAQLELMKELKADLSNLNSQSLSS